MNPGYGRNRTVHLLSGYILPPGPYCHSFERYCQLSGTITECSKSHSIVLSSQLLQDDEHHGKTSEFHGDGPIGCTSFAVKCLAGSNAVLYHDGG